MRTVLCLFSLLVFLLFPVSQSSADEQMDEQEWAFMPAGARPTYMGIHGGTMPVSLLVSDDGSSLLTFVGRTGNDFLELLHKPYFPLPSFLKKHTQNSTEDAVNRGKILMAGNEKVSMPVIYITGLGMQRSTVNDVQLMPFGLSEKPVSIEGTVAMPARPTMKPKRKNYRLFFEPNYLEPR